MEEEEKKFEELFEQAKKSEWKTIEETFKRNPKFGGEAVRYVDRRTGWTLLHEAVCLRSEEGIGLCLRYGADPTKKTNDDKLIIDFVEDDPKLVQRLAAAVIHDKNWSPVANPNLMAASNRYSEAVSKVAESTMKVAYAGGVVTILAGCNYYADAWGRVLIGWHGSFNPPRGMGGESMLELSSLE